MKTCACLSMIAFLWFTASIVCAACPADDLYEDNDSVETASALETGYLEVTGLSVFLTDPDFYLIPVSAGSTLEITLLFNHSAGDIDLVLFDSGLAMIASSAGFEDWETIEWTASEDTYVYLYVMLYDGGPCNDYTLIYNNPSVFYCEDDGDLCTVERYDPILGCVHEIANCDDGNPFTTDACSPIAGCIHSFTGCPEDDTFEENDYISEASPISSLPASIPNLISAYGDSDFYSIAVTSETVLTVDCMFTYFGGDIDLYLMDDQYTVLAYDIEVDDGASLVWPSTFDGTVYLLVEMGSLNYCAAYSLMITDECPDAVLSLNVEQVLSPVPVVSFTGTADHPGLLYWGLDVAGGSTHNWLNIFLDSQPLGASTLEWWPSAIEAGPWMARLWAAYDCGGRPFTREHLLSFTLGYPGDLDLDGDVDLQDFEIFAEDWLEGL